MGRHTRYIWIVYMHYIHIIVRDTQAYIQDPYIVSKQGDGTLTCYIFLHGERASSISFTWKENGNVLKNGGTYNITSASGTFDSRNYFNSTLTNMGMNIGNTGNRYTCQADVDDGIDKGTLTSEEYELDTFTLITSFRAPYMVSRLGKSVTLSISCDMDPTSARSPNGKVIFKTHYSMVYVQPNYVPKIKVGGVAISSGKYSISFVIQNTVDEDAGQYYCGMNRAGRQSLIIYDLQNPYIVSPPHLDRHYVHMTCLAYVRILPAVSSLNVSIIWRTKSAAIGSQRDYSVTASTLDEDWISSNLPTHSKEIQDGDSFSCLVEQQQGFRSEWSEPSTLNTNFSTQGNSTVRDGYDVEIRWKVTPLIKAVHLITNSFGQDIFVLHNLRIQVSSQYIARIRLGPIISSPKYGILSFTLYSVTSADAGRMTSRRASLVSTHNVSHSDGYLLIVIPDELGPEKTNKAGQQDVTVTVTNTVPKANLEQNTTEAALLAETVATTYSSSTWPKDEHAFPVAIVAGLSVVSLLIICGISLAVFIVRRRNAETRDVVYYDGRIYFV